MRDYSIKSLKEGEILLLENARFYAEEMMDLASKEHAQSYKVKKLSPPFDLFVNGAVSVSHRSHCSVVGFTEILSSSCWHPNGQGNYGFGKGFEDSRSSNDFCLRWN